MHILIKIPINNKKMDNIIMGDKMIYIHIYNRGMIVMQTMKMNQTIIFRKLLIMNNSRNNKWNK